METILHLIREKMVSNFPFQKTTLKEWLNSEEVKKGQEISPREFAEVWFNRMPFRPSYVKTDLIYAPTDGVVIHIGKYKPDQDVFDVKGQSYTINQVLDTEMDCNCYAIGIYLTAFSVHLARFPITGFLTKIEKLPCILTNNDTMVLVEHGVFKNKIENGQFKFAYRNERKLYEMWEPLNNIDVIFVSIADREVDSLLDFVDEYSPILQGERAQFITWGSYALLVVPERPHFELEFLVQPLDYVFAGSTPVFKVKRKEDKNG